MFTDEHAGTGHTTSKVINNQSPIDRLPEIAPDASVADKGNNLDSEKSMTTWRRQLGYFLNELEIQAENRAMMELDENSFDGEQWDELDKAIVEGRGQVAIVYNVIATSINWMLGTERRGRTDYKILPRRSEGAKAAQRKTDLMKYLADVNRSEFSISHAFEEQVKAGLGWLECGLQSDDMGEPLYDTAESWRNIVHDSAAKAKDYSDARFMFRTKWADLDSAKAMFPDRTDVLDRSSNHTYDHGFIAHSDGDHAMDSAEEERQDTGYNGTSHVDGGMYTRRERVRLIEGWYRIPIQEDMMSGGEFSGEVFDPYSEGHVNQVILGHAKVRKRLNWRMHVMIFTSAGPLWSSKSPYRHNKFPFTPLICYTRAKNGLPYGMIRNMLDLQKDINKRASKALHILSTNKVIASDDVTSDWKAFREEVARPDALLVKKKGSELDLNVDRDLAPAHMELMSRAIQMVQTISGVTDENMGRTTNATSGKAILARQDQGALATAPVFDNLRYARQIHGEKQLSLIEQFMSEEKQFRITNRRGAATHITVNDGLPENDIILSKADYIIAEDDWNSTIRQSQATELLELLKMLAPVSPQIVPMLLDLLVEMMDVPQSDEIVSRIRQITGAEDPDADPNEMTPEMQAMQQQKAAQAQLQQRAAMAELGKAEADAAHKAASARKTMADAANAEASLPKAHMDLTEQSVRVALEALTTPTAVNVADALAQEAETKAAMQLNPPQPQPQAQ